MNQPVDCSLTPNPLPVDRPILIPNGSQERNDLNVRSIFALMVRFRTATMAGRRVLMRVGFGRACMGIVALGFLLTPGAAAKWRYFRDGNAADSTPKPQAGFALMGGGAQQDAAFKFLCERASGGDFLILRANTEDDYAQKVNKETRSICPLNSAATIVFTEREDSEDPEIAQIIDRAEVIFIAGGDQSNYVRFWQDTPVQEALNRHISAGKPIGGSSAGLAVLGEFSFSAMIDTVTSKQALSDPYGNEVTLSRDFLRIDLLKGVITDTHFAKRDRMGRLVVFLARILQDGWAEKARSIAVEENAAVLLEVDGIAKVVGGPAYFIEARTPPPICHKGIPLRMTGVTVHRVQAGGTFNVKTWTAAGGDDYALSASDGTLKAQGSGHGVY
jgi:cyanophycinase